MTDLTYTTDKMFTTFFAETEQGAEAWNVLASETNGTAKFFKGQTKSVIAQLRKAGYKVSKAKPVTITLDDIFAELDDL